MTTLEKLERELRRIGAWDAGQGGVTLREEAPGVVTVHDESAEATVRVGTGVLEALGRVESGTGYEDVWAALKPFKLADATSCDGCEKLYEYAEGVDNVTGSRFGPCCSSREDVAAF